MDESQGYRLCCNFSVQGLANLVADLLSDDRSVNSGRALCGWVSVGCGSGEELAESQAEEMFRVLCAAMAKVMCTNKGTSDAQNVCKDLTRRLKDFIGIVSLRGVVSVGARGEFLEHETYCFESRFVQEEMPGEVLDIVKKALTKKSVDVEAGASCSACPSTSVVQASAGASGGEVVEILESDDEENTKESGKHPSMEPGNEGSSSSALLAAGSNTREDAGSPNSDWLTDPRGASSKKTESRTSAPGPLGDRRPSSTAQTAASSARMHETRKDLRPLPLPSSSRYATESSRRQSSGRRPADVKSTLETLQSELKTPSERHSSARASAPSSCSGDVGPELVCLADVAARKRITKSNGSTTARSGDSDIRSHFVKGAGQGKPGGNDVRAESDSNPLVPLEIVPGYGAEVKGWLHGPDAPSFFSRRDASQGVEIKCLADPRAQNMSLAEVIWAEEDSYKMWEQRAREYREEYEEAKKDFDARVDDVNAAALVGDLTPVPARQDAQAADETRTHFLEVPCDDTLKYRVVIERSVLAAIVDIAYGDTEHESVGLLYGEIREQRKEIVVSDCRSLKRHVDKLNFDSVYLDLALLLEHNDEHTKGGKTMVGWFHSHLRPLPVPSAADVEVHKELCTNLFQDKTLAENFVGLICCLDSVSASSSRCNRVTWTAFRASTASEAVRVQWGVKETTGMSFEAVQRCFECVRLAEKENKEMCQELCDSQSIPVRNWLHIKWQEYVTRLLQGTMALALGQVEQSSQNLRLQRAQMRFGRANHVLKGFGDLLKGDTDLAQDVMRSSTSTVLKVNAAAEGREGRSAVLPRAEAGGALPDAPGSRDGCHRQPSTHEVGAFSAGASASSGKVKGKKADKMSSDDSDDFAKTTTSKGERKGKGAFGGGGDGKGERRESKVDAAVSSSKQSATR